SWLLRAVPPGRAGVREILREAAGAAHRRDPALHRSVRDQRPCGLPDARQPLDDRGRPRTRAELLLPRHDPGGGALRWDEPVGGARTSLPPRRAVLQLAVQLRRDRLLDERDHSRVPGHRVLCGADDQLDRNGADCLVSVGARAGAQAARRAGGDSCGRGWGDCVIVGSEVFAVVVLRCGLAVLAYTTFSFAHVKITDADMEELDRL